ncbi:MAG: hypothetical protein ACPG7F_02495 [Aggregatilineales bacterium]
MTITYHVAVDRDDDGNFTDLTDLISNGVLALRWRIGMDNPDDHMAGIARAKITLYSPSGAYSPEINALLPGKRLRIQSDDGTITRTHFTGYITEIRPAPGDRGGNTAQIIAEDVSHWFSENQVRLPFQTESRADESIQTILEQLTLRQPILQNFVIIGLADNAELDRDKLFGAALDSTLETGISIFECVGDTWTDGIPADRAIETLARSEQGYFFINRSGAAIFYNRHHTLSDAAPAATFSDDMRDLQYSYGNTIVNQVQVRITPCSIGAAGTTLWQLDTFQAITPGTIRQFRCQYQDENDNPVGAIQVDVLQPGIHYTANSRGDNTGNDEIANLRLRVLKTDISATTLEIENTSNRPIYLTDLVLTGTPIHRGDSLLLTHSDPTSMTLYGVNRLLLDLPALTSLDDADNLARYTVTRRKNPRGTVHSLSTDARQHPTETLSLTLFDRIALTESQTGHSDTYHIVTEQHDVTKGGRQHRVTWQLQPTDTGRFVIIGTSKPDGTAALAY